MKTALLDCGHVCDSGPEHIYNDKPAWEFVRLDDGRKVCKACAALIPLDCGHLPSPHSPLTTGYGVRPDGKKVCYACCADDDRAQMIADGHATLYLSKDSAGKWTMSNWPGSLRFNTFNFSKSARGGGFGSQRMDVDFVGPDGWIWHVVNRGDMQIARCKRTKRQLAASVGWQSEEVTA